LVNGLASRDEMPVLQLAQDHRGLLLQEAPGTAKDFRFVTLNINLEKRDWSEIPLLYVGVEDRGSNAFAWNASRLPFHQRGKPAALW
jgi:hypothetical protein